MCHEIWQVPWEMWSPRTAWACWGVKSELAATQWWPKVLPSKKTKQLASMARKTVIQSLGGLKSGSGFCASSFSSSGKDDRGDCCAEGPLEVAWPPAWHPKHNSGDGSIKHIILFATRTSWKKLLGTLRVLCLTVQQEMSVTFFGLTLNSYWLLSLDPVNRLHMGGRKFFRTEIVDHFQAST